eukprot:scaffold4244_cov167-Amphora_coffeaeformis.AAC.9
MNRNSAVLFTSRQRKNHPWIRLDEDNNHPSERQQQQRASRRSKMRLSVDTSLSVNDSRRSVASEMDHPEEPGAISKRRSPTTVSPSGSSSVTTGTTFQQYRQQRSVRKHPWRTDVKGRGSNKRGVKSWRNLVKSAAPWDEVPTIIEEEEDWVTKTESKDDEVSVTCALSVAGDVVRECSGCDEIKEEKETPKDNLLEDLQDRLKKVYQGDHYIVQGTGTGHGKRTTPVCNEQENLVRQQLVKALRDRLRNYYTGHLVSFEAYGKQGAKSPVMEEKSGGSSDEEGSDDGSAVSVDESVVSVQSMIVAATILNSATVSKSPRRDITVSRSPRAPLDDDEWTEYTVESRATNVAPSESQTVLLGSVSVEDTQQSEWEEYTVYEDEAPQSTGDSQEEWEEETVATEALSPFQKIQLLQTMLSPMGKGEFEKQQSEEECEWDEYTVETAALQSGKVVTPSVAPSAEDDDDDEWDEYTVETIADALLSLPRALQMHQFQSSTPVAQQGIERQDSGSSSKSPSSIADTVKDIVRDSNSRLASKLNHLHDVESVSYVDEIIEEDDDDDHWDDYTVETVADAFASLPRSLQLEFVRASTRNVHQEEEEEEQEEDASDCSSQPPPVGAYDNNPVVEATETRGGDEWTEITCEETIRDIPGILRQADSAKSTSNQPKKPGQKPIITDPTLSSTDSESETWHDARSSGSGDPAVLRETSSAGSAGGSSSRSTMSGRRRTRSPPTNLNKILNENIFSKDLSVVEGALRTLTRKADDDLEYRAHIVRSGGILAVVRAMQQNVYQASVQMLACETLQKIATDKENRVAVGEVGGVEAVVGAMAEHMDEEVVAESTCEALWVLTSNCPQNQLSIETAALDVIVSCMRRYAKNPTIQEKAFQTLANLCLEHEEKLVALSQMGGFVVMSTALVLHWEHPTVKNEAISTLAQLFGRLAVSQTP